MQVIVAFTGKKGSGKDTCAHMMETRFIELRSENISEGYPKFRQINFADKLKRACMDLFGLTYNECYDPKYKDKQLDRWPYQTPRFILQRFATECVRAHWPDLWIQAWMREIHVPLAGGNSVMLTDLRFPNERDALIQTAARYGVQTYVINVDRPGLPEDLHESESHVGKLRHHLTIYNHGSLEDLQKNIINLCDHIWVGRPK